MPDDLNFDVTARDKASDVVDAVAKKADRLDGTDVAVDVDAEDQASRVIADVDQAADALDGRDITADVKVTGAGAAADDMDRFRKSAEDAGGSAHIGGNAIADMAGPLGDAEGAASTAAGVFDGLADTVEGLAPKLGLSAAAASSIATGLGLVGFAVAGVAALYTKITGDAKKAREEAARFADEQRQINDLLKEGRSAAAGAKFLDLYDGLPEAAGNAGIALEEATRFITGQTDVLPALNSQLAVLRGELAKAAEAAAENRAFEPQAQAIEDQIGVLERGKNQLVGLRDEYVKNGDTARTTAGQERQVGDALQGTATGAEAARIAEENLRLSRIEAANSTFAYQRAMDDLADAHGETGAAALTLIATQNDAKATAFDLAAANEGLQEAQENETAAAFDAAAAAQQLATDTAAAKGETLDAKGQQDAYVGSLIDTARKTSGPVHDSIVNHIALVEGIPPEKVTDILAQPTGTAEASAALDQVALPNGKPREAPVDVFVRGINQARSLLFGVGAVPGAAPAGPVPAGLGAAPAGRVGAVPFASPAAVTVPVTVHVDARGALDPYSVGRRVEQAMRSWARVSGEWRPGVPA